MRLEQLIGQHSIIQSHLRLQADVVLRGYSGYNLKWAAHMLQAIFPLDAPSPPDLATVFFGANDAALKGGCK